MSGGTYTGWFKASTGHTFTVEVRDGTTITVAELDGEDIVAVVDLSKADAEQVWAAKPTEPRIAWSTGGAITIAPDDVDEFADNLRGAYNTLT